MHSTFQLHTNPEEYGFSKDVDVALWLDCRAYCRESKGFVTVDGSLHKEYKEFRAEKMLNGKQGSRKNSYTIGVQDRSSPSHGLCKSVAASTSSCLVTKLINYVHGCMQSKISWIKRGGKLNRILILIGTMVTRKQIAKLHVCKFQSSRCLN